MKSVILWIFGASGAGKETFIKSASQSENVLLDRLGLTNLVSVVCQESLGSIAQTGKDNDPMVLKRRELPEVISKMVNQENIVVLVKGQEVNLENGTLLSTKNMTPSAEHRIVFLHVGLDELYNRCRKKDWWEEKKDRQALPEWRIAQI